MASDKTHTVAFSDFLVIAYTSPKDLPYGPNSPYLANDGFKSFQDWLVKEALNDNFANITATTITGVQGYKGNLQGDSSYIEYWIEAKSIIYNIIPTANDSSSDTVTGNQIFSTIQFNP